MKLRFIPTCMGNSRGPRSRRLLRAVHPHVHGELGIPPSIRSGGLGSSPRAWGTQQRPRLDRRPARFIPTCMGNSCQSQIYFKHLTVHPHVHGELLRCRFLLRGCGGSSPRAWGTRPTIKNISSSLRFIPTCMGNSVQDGVRAIRWVVHPHVHGELKYCHDQIDCWFGSSPRAWGTLAHALEPSGIDRFIPTCMGNSSLEGVQA